VLNTSASPYTLKVMLIVVLLFVPLVVAYQLWAYRRFTYKLGPEEGGY